MPQRPVPGARQAATSTTPRIACTSIHRSVALLACRRPAFVRFRTSDLRIAEQTTRQHLLSQFVVQAVSQHVERSRSMPTLSVRRRAQSPCAPRAPTRDYASCAHDLMCAVRGSIAPTLWERLSMDICVWGAPPSSPLPGVAMGPPLQRLRRCEAVGV